MKIRFLYISNLAWVLFYCGGEPVEFRSVHPNESNTAAIEKNFADGDQAAASKNDNAPGGDSAAAPKNDKYNPPPQKPNTNPPPLTLNCDTAGSMQKLFTLSVPVKFPGHPMGKDQVCDWEKNGNNKSGFEIKVDYKGKTVKEELFNGRRRQFQYIPLAPNVEVCSMEFEFTSQTNNGEKLVFDDILFFTIRSMFNDQALSKEVILASSQNYTEYFEQENEFVYYRWEDLRSHAFNHFKEFDTSTQTISDRTDHAKHARVNQNYCFGVTDNENCSLPLHEDKSEGNIYFKPSKEAVAKLSQYVTKGNGLEFGLIITGDSEDSDCQHNNDIEFDVHFKMYSKQ